MMWVHVQDGKTCLEIAFEHRHEDVIEHLCGLRVKTLVMDTIKVSEILHVLPEQLHDNAPGLLMGMGFVQRNVMMHVCAERRVLPPHCL